MQLPNRKPGKYTFTRHDPHITEDKLQELEYKLDQLINFKRPRAIKEVKRLGENGDFSENAEYQIAKGKLRGINRAIDETQRQIDKATIIEPKASTFQVAMGHKVTINDGEKEMTYQILGPTETDPKKGIISYKSPLGEALLNKKVGDCIEVNKNKFKIKDIK